MEWSQVGALFMTVFLAELGDKTQLATVLFAARNPASPWTVFLVASAALMAACAVAVLAGSWVEQYLEPRTVARAAGAGFIAIGLLTLARA